MFSLQPGEVDQILDSFSLKTLIQQGASSLVIILVMIALYRFARYAISHLVTRPESRQRYWSYSRLLFVVLGAVLLGAVWIEEVKTVSLLLTGLIAATMIVSKEVLLGVAGRLSLAVADHYELGDRITINGVCGDVINIGLLYTWLLEVANADVETQGTGRVVLIPHLWLVLHPVFNSTLGHEFIFDEVEVALPVDTKIEDALRLMTGVADKVMETQIAMAALDVPRLSRSYAAKTPPVTPIAYTRIRVLPSGHQYVSVFLRYSVRTRERRQMHSLLTIRLLAALRDSEITLYSAMHTLELTQTQHAGDESRDAPEGKNGQEGDQ